MHNDIIVIGAGQAGLAVGYHLAKAGADFTIIDGGQRVGDAWRSRWDSLKLFTPARYNALPGLPFPGDPAAYPSKDELADYLESYAERFALPVRLRTRARRLTKVPSGFVIDTPRGEIRARRVVVASGSHALQVIPSFAGDLAPSIVQMTATRYTNPDCLPPGDTLVVGAGNSGAQIAMELASTRTTSLAGPRTGHVPARVLGTDLFWWLDHFGVLRWDSDNAVGRRVIARAAGRGDPVVGLTPEQIEAAGITRRRRVVGVRDGLPLLADGTVVDVRSVVWCCGIVPDFRWIEGLSVDAHGTPLHRRGRAENIADLFFAGLRFQMRLGSATVGGVGRDAEEIVAAILDPRVRLTSGASRRGAQRAGLPADRSAGSRASSSTSG